MKRTELLSELRPIFHPRTVALVGASSGSGKVGRMFMERFVEAGFEKLYPVNPREKEILGVETYASVPSILLEGPDWFAGMGTENSGGTKAFALAGAVERSGLVEVPIGMTLREMIYEIGGGCREGRVFKAVQLGGPSGGCIPAELLDTRIDYEDLQATGAIMGSGGMIVADDTTCMVDIARYFLTFTQDESCGKCIPCRVGTRKMLNVLTAATEGRATAADIDRTHGAIKATS